VSRLAAPITIAEARRYRGCVSWVELDDAIDVDGAQPSMRESELSARVARLAEALGESDAK
jgi:hypothetical protein